MCFSFPSYLPQVSNMVSIHFGNQDLAKKYSNYGKYHSNVELLKSWILEGDWDEVKIKKYFIETFNPKTFTDKHKFLNWYVWDLDETTMQKGYIDIHDHYVKSCESDPDRVQKAMIVCSRIF